MFWAILLISVGTVLLLNAIFGIDLPIMRILFGVFLVYIGVSILFGAFHLRIGNKISSDTEAIFSKSEFVYHSSGGGDNNHSKSRINREFTTVFGEGVLDLLDVEVADKSIPIKVNSVFGTTTIKIKRGLPFRVKSNVVFGSAELPERNYNALGQFQYNSPAAGESGPALRIELNVVFGHAKVVEE